MGLQMAAAGGVCMRMCMWLVCGVKKRELDLGLGLPRSQLAARSSQLQLRAFEVEGRGGTCI